MYSYRCPRCDQLVFFENSECLNCGLELRFSADRLAVVGVRDGDDVQRCANQDIAGCNWLLDAPAEDGLCVSCRLTRTRPDDSDTGGLAAFAETEAAKRRVVFEILHLGLPLRSWEDQPGGLGYDLLSSADESVIIGHEDGIITIDLAESDDPHREQIRQQMGEPYRTMLGHLRHETGHYYWPVLVEQTGRVEDYRALFGDERADYGEAMTHHYDNGPTPGWEDDHVSAYATMHPWEDWAETFAHYLHIRDTLQTAAAYGMRVDIPGEKILSTNPSIDVNDEQPFAAILADWLPLTYALNAVNRSMGRDDLYPFVLSPAVIEKLTWVHHAVTASAQPRTSVTTSAL
jgi:hypothetical protein